MTDTDYMNMSAFSCGVELLDKFFHYEIKECVNHHYLSAYCAFLDSKEIVAVFTLMNDALMIVSHTEKEDFIDDMRLDTSSDVVDFLNANHHIRLLIALNNEKAILFYLNNQFNFQTNRDHYSPTRRMYRIL